MKNRWIGLGIAVAFLAYPMITAFAGSEESEDGVEETIKTEMSYREAIQMVTDILKAFEEPIGSDPPEVTRGQADESGRGAKKRAKPKKELCWGVKKHYRMNDDGSVTEGVRLYSKKC